MSARPDDDFSPPYRWPFLVGLYMAVNAIPDAYVVIDGPDCVFRKAEWIQGKHDWSSTLLNVFGTHRIANSMINPHNVTKSRGESVIDRVRQIDKLPDAGLVFVSSMPITTIIGTQYDQLLRDEQPRVAPRLVDVPGRGLDGDWLTGYSDALMALAAHVDVTGAEPSPDRVGIVGHLMDRVEADQTSNVRELERLVEALDLEVASIWLSNRPLLELERIRSAGTLLALPLGRRAAGILAQRTGAKVVEVETPFGPGATQRLLRSLAHATGREAQAERFIDRELRRLVPRLEWVVPHLFMGRRAFFSGSPCHFGGFVELARELGMDVLHLSAPASSDFLTAVPGERPPPPMLFEPRSKSLHAALRELGHVDLAVCPSWIFLGCSASAWKGMLEFGFPSTHSHALYERPHLGFDGWMCFVDRMSDAISRSNR